MSSGDETAKDTAPASAPSALPNGRLPARPTQAADTPAAGKGRFLAKKTVEDRRRGGGEPTPPRPEAISPGEKPLDFGEEASLGEHLENENLEALEKKKPARKARKKDGADLWRAALSMSLPIVPALAAGVIFAALVALPVYQQGEANGRKQAKNAPVSMDIPPEVNAQVDDALLELRNGDPAKALATLRQIQEKQPRYPSVSYLMALAATQAGDKELASRFAQETIAKRERVSDAFALLAVLESMPSSGGAHTVMGDPKVKAENYLRQAIQADPANAAPHFELATLLRYANRRDEARHEIRAAQARLNPVDAHMVIEVTLALMDLEEKSDDALPAAPATARNPSEAYGGALVAMRKGDFAHAARLLEAAKAMSNYDIFHYLVNDPVLRRYRDQPELANFWP